MARGSRRLSAVTLAVALAVGAEPTPAQQELKGLDAYIQKAMNDLGVAGMSVAIVKDGAVVYAKGFGVREAGKGEPVDENTLFAIGSNTKLFTAVAAGMLVDEKRMEWDGKVTDYLPWFQLSDPWVTREFTLRDALSHRSGLGRRGDALWYGTDLSREEIIRRVRFLEPNSSFRSQYGYQNIMVLTAGEAVAAASGKSWDDFVDERIFAPLGMERSITSAKPLARMQNVSQPHSATPEGPKAIPWRDIDNVGPAGSINSSALEMTRWIQFLLGKGKYGGEQLLQEQTLRVIMSAHTITGNPADTLAPSRHFSTYGLGVGLSDYKGYKVQSHTGGIDGMLSNVTTVPEKNVGWVILTNTSPNSVYTALSNYLLDTFLGGDRRDWCAIALEEWNRAQKTAAEQRAEAERQRAKDTKPSLALEKYAGAYAHVMYGELAVALSDGVLRLSWGPWRDVPLEHWHFDTFVLRAAGLGGDVTGLSFRLNARGEVGDVVVAGVETFERRPAAPPAAPGAARGAPVYDLVIRNGRVLDGGGNPWIRADVAIRGGRFARVGVVEGRGVREIDAAGKYVSPGWFDMMDQSGGALLYNPLAENKLLMGVTTAIAGEGGTPSLPQEREAERRGATTANIPAYFQALEDSAISLNFGTYYSETQARTAVLGSSAREPTPPELERMKAAMDSAMKAGVLGMTTALIYPPSSYSSTEELVAVAKAMAPWGGIYATHVRGEGKELVQSIREAIRIGEEAGVPVEVFHLKAAYQPGWGTLMKEAIDTINAARARGVDVAADLYPYTAGGTGLEATIPSWAFEGGADSLRARLTDPATRARLRRQVETGAEGWWNIVEASGGWQNIVLANARNPEYARFQGQSIARIAEQLGKDPIDAAWDIALAGGGRVGAIYHMMSEGDIVTALGQPWVSIGSDAGAALRPGEQDALGLPHPRAYGTHPRVLKRFVRELGALTLPEAIRRMTSWPATRMRIADRGMIREGLWADVVVFDFDAIDDRATFEHPIAYPTGIEYVLVNGVVTVEKGQHTGARAGHVLYGPGKARR